MLGAIFLAAVVCALGCAAEEAAIEPVYTTVTVTAERGAPRPSGDTAQVSSSAAVRAEPTAAHALFRSPGVLIQQTTPGQVSPFLRGFTGYHVLNLIDGVRFNNTTFRSGPNQYLAYVEPLAVQRVEAVLGPAASQYGSDSLGGTMNVLTRQLRFPDKLEVHGSVAAQAASTDWSTGSGGEVELASRRWAWLAGGSGSRFGDLRPGGGFDSRDVFYRMFGVRGLVGPRLHGTAYSRAGFHSKGSVALGARTMLTGWYQRSGLDGVQGYKDLLGGLGRVRSDFAPQRLDFGYMRLERMEIAGFESVSGTVSLNRQLDGSVRQGLRFTDAITRDRVDARAVGYAGQAVKRIGARHLIVAGGDVHDERVRAWREQNGTSVRPLYPSGARYTTGAVFGQGSAELAGGRVRLSGGGRFTRVRYADQTFGDVTFHSAVTWQATSVLGLHALAGRGFRAPNLNDLGGLGLNDLGYEVPASEVAGALIGASAGEGALPLSLRVSALKPESLINYEAGVRIRSGRSYLRVQGFDSEFRDPIDRRTLLFPAASVPAQVAGLAVTPLPQSAEQRAAGVVTVATALDPRAVKAFVNEGRARYYGFEANGEQRISGAWMLRGSYSFLHGRLLDPNRPVRRLPPQIGHGSVLYAPGARRWWIEARGSFAGAQSRLSGGDLDDERIGASRSRRDIAQFFAGDIAASYVAAGVFQPTGETLAHIQQRVLPGVSSETQRVPLYRSTASWAALDVASGVRVNEHTTLGVTVNNVLDRNYRLHGSGVDAPGVGVSARLALTF